MGHIPFSRNDRLASLFQTELAEMIRTKHLKELKDPLFVGLVSIVEVKVSKGYQHADVFLTVFEEEHVQNVLKVLNASTSALRGELCRRCKLRVAPTLAFHLDESVKRGDRLTQLLDQIAE